MSLSNKDLELLYEAISLMNPEELVKDIENKLKNKQLTPQMHSVIIKRFTKFFVSDDRARPVSVDDYQIREGDPEWMRGTKAFFSLAPQDVQQLQHVADWLKWEDREGDLNKAMRADWKTMLVKAGEWVEEINKREMAAEDAANLRKWMEWPDGFSIMELQGDACLSREGKLMGHCVGGGGYEGGATTILSLRDKNNNPHVTFELRAGEPDSDGGDEGWGEDEYGYDEPRGDANDIYIVQVQGKGNEPPHKKYHKYVVDFIKKYPDYSVEEDITWTGGIDIDDMGTYVFPGSPEYDRYKKSRTETVNIQLTNIKKSIDRGLFKGSISIQGYGIVELEIPEWVKDVDLTGDDHNEGSLRLTGFLALNNLNNLPKVVEGIVDLSFNHITSLVGSNLEQCGSLKVSNNELTSFEGMPVVKKDLSAYNNRITSFKGAKFVGERVFIDRAGFDGVEEHPYDNSIAEKAYLKHIQNERSANFKDFYNSENPD
tara:strand:- start:30400 stop:31857 length:1458 start_codon:yes stop_codon:yes gene_type:complete